MVNTDFKRGFEKVAVSSKLIRSAYAKSLKSIANESKASVADLKKIKKLTGQSEYFAKKLDGKLAKEIPKKPKIGTKTNDKSLVGVYEKARMSSSDAKKLVG